MQSERYELMNEHHESVAWAVAIAMTLITLIVCITIYSINEININSQTTQQIVEKDNQ